MKNITFMRHAATEYVSNVDSDNINMLDPNVVQLSRIGISQVHNVASKIKNLGFDVIVCTQSLRTRQTAEILQQYINAPVIIEPGLDCWKAETVEKYLSEKEYWKRFVNFVKVNGRSSSLYNWEDFETLKNRTFEAIKKYEKYENVLFVVHSIIMSMYIGRNQPSIAYCEFVNREFNSEFKPVPPEYPKLF